MCQGDVEGYLAKHQRYPSVSPVVGFSADSRDCVANGLPESAGITTRDFLCFFLFSLISLPAIWFPIHQMYVLPAKELLRHRWPLISLFKRRHLFTLKAVVVPIAGIIFFVWCIVKAHGIGPVVKQPAQIHGSDLSWAMVFSLMSCISNMATLITCVLLPPCLIQVSIHIL